MTLLTATLGFLSVRLHEDKEAAQAQAISLSTEVSVLTEQVTILEIARDELAGEAARAREERDLIQQDLDRVLAEGPAEGPHAPPSDPFPATLTYLSDERALTSQGFSSRSASVSGEVYLHSVTGRQGFCSGEATQAFADYNLGRAYERFTATLGLSDINRRASHRVRFEVILDERQIHEATLTAGQAEPLDLPIDGGLRLRLQVTFFADGECSSNDINDRAVFGDAALVPPARTP